MNKHEFGIIQICSTQCSTLDPFPRKNQPSRSTFFPFLPPNIQLDRPHVLVPATLTSRAEVDRYPSKASKSSMSELHRAIDCFSSFRSGCDPSGRRPEDLGLPSRGEEPVGFTGGSWGRGGQAKEMANWGDVES